MPDHVNCTYLSRGNIMGELSTSSIIIPRVCLKIQWSQCVMAMNSHWMYHNQQQRAATQPSLYPGGLQKWQSREGSVKRFLLLPEITNPGSLFPSSSSASLRISASQRGTFDVVESIRCDMTQWLEHMSSSEECSDRERDGARCFSQQWSFHPRLALPFMMLKPLKCACRQFFIQQRWGLRTELLRNTVSGWKTNPFIKKCCFIWPFELLWSWRINRSVWGNGATVITAWSTLKWCQ